LLLILLQLLPCLLALPCPFLPLLSPLLLFCFCCCCLFLNLGLQLPVQRTNGLLQPLQALA
jgi:hypothetical protein